MPIIFGALFVFRRWTLADYVSLQIFGFGMAHMLIIFGLLPIFTLYHKHYERISKKKPTLQIFMFSVWSILSLHWLNMQEVSILEDSQLVTFLGLYLLTFNLSYPVYYQLYDKWDCLTEVQKWGMFGRYPPEHPDDFSRFHLFFIVIGIAPFFVDLVR